MRVLLSIKPKHVENIIEGKKKFELRRKIFKRSDVNIIVMYSTKPVSRIVGEFDIARIISDEPEQLWKTVHNGSGINRILFDEYFSGRTEGFALEIGEVRTLQDALNPYEVLPKFTPPQSFMYINDKYSQSEKVQKSGIFKNE